MENASLSDSVCPSYSFFFHSSIFSLLFSILLWAKAFKFSYHYMLYVCILRGDGGGGDPPGDLLLLIINGLTGPVKGAYSLSCEAKVEAASEKQKFK